MLPWQAIAAGVVLVVGAVGLQQLRVTHWQSVAGEARQATAQCQADLAEAQQGIRDLATQVERQNDYVRSLEERSSALADRAAVAALRVVRQAEPAHRAIEGSSAGPEEMNRWLRRTFAAD